MEPPEGWMVSFMEKCNKWSLKDCSLVTQDHCLVSSYLMWMCPSVTDWSNTGRDPTYRATREPFGWFFLLELDSVQIIIYWNYSLHMKWLTHLPQWCQMQLSIKLHWLWWSPESTSSSLSIPAAQKNSYNPFLNYHVTTTTPYWRTNHPVVSLRSI